MPRGKPRGTEIPSKWPQPPSRAEASLEALMVKNLPAMQENRVPSLCREDSLEKGMGTHSSILIWKFPWTEEPRGL